MAASVERNQERPPSRYCVGIDLGTTNTVLSYVDTSQEQPEVRTLGIPQIVAPGEFSVLPALPSFIYLPEEGEILPGQFSLPWAPDGMTSCIGEYAREMSAKAPGQVVTSAKSWLCCDRIDRHGEVLPTVGASPTARRISPVQASAMILEHLKSAWNHAMAPEHPEDALENQEIILTVPASFDAVARDLTVEAARKAGLHFTLLEEPQAAFYAWLSAQGEEWRHCVSDGDVILVCDIGGGTTDFSLIAVTDEGGDLTLQRLAVGNHTLLGGDNMDLALAYAVGARLQLEQNITLNNGQFTALTHACRKAKEAFGSGNQDDQTLVILGEGSKLLGNTLRATLTYDEFKDMVLDGFLPACSISDLPLSQRHSGLRALALDYAADPAITHHLAGFLEANSFKDGDGHPILPSVVLFNGGVTKPPLFRNRMIETIQSWHQPGDAPIQILEQPEADQSVAKGAAWLATVKRKGGIRIKAGSPRSYYLGIDDSRPAIPGVIPPVNALCVVNVGLEEGSSIDIPASNLALLVGEPTEFRVFTSTTRHEDAIGQILELQQNDSITELPPLKITLPATIAGGAAGLEPVTLRTVLTDIGTLQIWCKSTRRDNAWQLEFDLR